MPFTLSHTLAILPLRRFCTQYLSFTGLFVGSMVPDFEFFVRITLYGVWGHTFLGIFYFDIPLGIILCFIFHHTIKNQLICHSPQFIYQRFEKELSNNWCFFLKQNKLKVVISLFLGILTHFVWDNITHEPNYISPIYFDVLLKEIKILDITYPTYHFLQIFSSITSLVGLLIMLFLVPKNGNYKRNLNKEPIAVYWIKILVLSFFTIYIRYYIGVPNEKPMGQFVVICISSFLISLTIISALYKYKTK